MRPRADGPPAGRDKPVRVLGIDTSLRSSGLGVVEAVGSSLRLLHQQTVATPARHPLSECLRRLDEALRLLLDQQKPAAAALEGIFYCKNVKTAVILGEARGVVIARCAAAAVPVFEYPPRRVKQALVGHGDAEKEQVARMVMRLLGLTEQPQEDAADALAIAICHLHSRTGMAALQAKPL